EKRDWLEKQIMALLPAMSPDAKENLRHQFHATMPSHEFAAFGEQAGKYLVSTASMERRLENLRIGKDYEDKTVEELTAEVAQQRTIGGFPPLPSNATKIQI